MFGTKSSVQRQSQSTVFVPIRLTLPTPALLAQKRSRAKCPLRCMVMHHRGPKARARPSCLTRNAYHRPKGNEAWEGRQGQTSQSGGPGRGPNLKGSAGEGVLERGQGCCSLHRSAGTAGAPSSVGSEMFLAPTPETHRPLPERPLIMEELACGEQPFDHPRRYARFEFQRASPRTR